jgi:hypothetical protein
MSNLLAQFPWLSSTIAQFCSEIILQIITSYWMGKTANFGAYHGYLLMYGEEYVKLKGPIGRWALAMYAAALLWLCTAFFTGVICLTAVFLVMKKIFKKEQGGFLSGSGMVDKAIKWFMASALLTTWLANWLFWAGFVHVTGDL